MKTKTRDELQDLIISICARNGISMNYVVSGEIADAIEMEGDKVNEATTPSLGDSI